MTLEIKQGDFEAFFQAPLNAYGENTHYVSPLKSDLQRFVSPKTNPLFKDHPNDICIFTAHQSGKPIGRITAHVHRASNRKHNLNRAYFGYFDCADNKDAATALLNAAELWAKERGFDEIIGNFNLTAMQQIGIVTDHFDFAPYTDLIYSPPHIAKHLEENGYVAEFPMTTFELDLENAEAPAIGPKQQAVLDNPDFEFRPIKRSEIADRMEDSRKILNASFARNPMFVPVSKAEYDFQAQDMKWVMDPRISAVLYWKGQPAACIICIPDLNPFLKKIGSKFSLNAIWHFLWHKFTCKRAVLIFSGVIPELQGQGVNPVVLRQVILALKKAKYTHLGNTWIADQNKASLAQKSKAHARPMHRLHLYKKVLN
ncbi:hypothetical protein [Maritalea myrionectae]|uniref:hypothetical protein n=1 Tax=Maritalea myrionectae TaxID=454601 RepID=UPI00041BA323|nr:hypothetical protein [Maritalea myrionectae]